MPYSAAGKNNMLDALGATHASLHTADPGATGTNEVTGGSPAYARKPIAFDAADGGTKGQSGTIDFDVPASTTITHVGYWDALSGGNFLCSDDLAAPETYGSQGIYTLTETTLTINDA